MDRIVISLMAILLTLSASAQRNLVEVPSSEIVEQKKLFTQAQLVFEPNSINTSFIATYGLPKNFEVGIVLYKFDFKRSSGVEINSENPEENPDLLINAQKGFELTEWFKLGLGTRTGVNLARHNDDVRLVNFTYLNSQITFGKGKHMVIAGAYYGNDAYVTEGTNVGIMAGVDVNLYKDKLHLVGDFLSGTSAISIMNAALQLSLPNAWKIMCGAQLPVPGSNNDYGGIIQISRN